MNIFVMSILQKINDSLKAKMGKGFVAMFLIALCLASSSFAGNSVNSSVSSYLLGDFAFADAKKKVEGSVKEFYQSARSKIEKGRYVAAIEDLKKAFAVDKKNADVWSLYGFAARKAGSLQLAEKAYEQALSLEPNHLGALEYSGELYIQRDELDKAQERIKQLKALCPQGCKELAQLERAMSVKASAGASAGDALEDISHKIPKLKW